MMRGPVCRSRWVLDSLLWGDPDPRYPNGYRGGCASVRVDVFRLRASWTLTRSRYHFGRADRVFNYDGNTHELRAFGFTFGAFCRYRRHCSHLSIGPLTLSVIDTRVIGDCPGAPLWPVLRGRLRALLRGF